MAKKILVADDDRKLAADIAKWLRKEGHEAIVVSEGYLVTKVAHQEKPDLIITDIMMPAGSGIKSSEHLQMSYKTATIPIIFITGCQDIEAIKKAKEYGKLLIKPIKKEQLLEEVEMALG